jgi:hypothetical protein
MPALRNFDATIRVEVLSVVPQEIEQVMADRPEYPVAVTIVIMFEVGRVQRYRCELDVVLANDVYV